MAGPIRIAIVADAAAATRSVGTFAEEVDNRIGGVGDTMRDAARTTDSSSRDISSSFDRATDGADRSEQRAQGFSDTLTGTADVMAGTAQIAKGDLFGGLVTLGGGFADLAGGAAAFLIPALQKAAGAMKALNLTFLTNPVFLVIAAIVALVAVFVIAYKKSETFRRIVDGAFRGVLRIVTNVWNWIRSNWPLLLAIITGPIGLAVRFVVKNFDTIKAKVQEIPDRIRGVFRNAKDFLVNAGRQIVEGLWNGVRALSGWIADRVRGFISNNITGPIQRALRIFSPSKVMEKLGTYIPAGLAIGIAKATGKVRSATASMTAATVPTPRASGAAGGAGLVLRIDSAGSRLDELLLDTLRRAIRAQGGNVQAVLGRG